MTLQDYQPIVDRVLNHFNVHPDSLKVKVKDVKMGGRTGWRYRGGRTLCYMTLPKWLEGYDKQYAIYYAVHETCHIVNYFKGKHNGIHCENFKRIEDEALALWGIRIVRMKAYPKELYANGQQVYNIVRKKQHFLKV